MSREDDRNLTTAILAATTGAPCPRAETRLVQRWGEGGPLPPLLAEHLDHCRRCRELAEALAFLPATLRDLRDRPADPRLTAAILRRTIPLLHRRRCRRSARWREVLAAWWETRVEQPGFVAELALTVTLGLALLGWLPGGAVPPPRPDVVVTRVAGDVGEAAACLRTVALRAVSEGEEEAAPVLRDLKRTLTGLARHVRRTAGRAGRWLPYRASGDTTITRPGGFARGRPNGKGERP